MSALSPSAFYCGYAAVVLLTPVLVPLVIASTSYDAFASRRFARACRRCRRCSLEGAAAGDVRRVVAWRRIVGGGFASNDEEAYALETETRDGERRIAFTHDLRAVETYVHALTGRTRLRLRHAGNPHASHGLILFFLAPPTAGWIALGMWLALRA